MELKVGILVRKGICIIGVLKKVYNTANVSPFETVRILHFPVPTTYEIQYLVFCMYDCKLENPVKGTEYLPL